MTGTAIRDKVEDPCSACQDRHLKCDNDRPKCQQCTRMNHQCQRLSASVKFKPGSSKGWDRRFGSNQTWLPQTRHAKVQFHDEGPDLKNEYSVDELERPTQKIKQVSPESILQHGSYSAQSPSAATPHSTSSWILTPTDPVRERTSSVASRATISPSSAVQSPSSLTPLKRPYPDDTAVHLHPVPLLPLPRNFLPPFPPVHDMRNTYNIYPPRNRDATRRHSTDMPELPRQIKAEYDRLEDDEAAAIPAEEFLSPEQWKRHFKWPNHKTTNLCECLMRYFIEELAPWFDAGDPSQTFAKVVPCKALIHPALLNAVFTAASWHLITSRKHRDPNTGAISYKDIPLPKLTQQTCVKYLNATTTYLSRAIDHQYLCEPEFLATAVLLRFAAEYSRLMTGNEDLHPQVNNTCRYFFKARESALSQRASNPPNHINWMQSSHPPTYNGQGPPQQIGNQDREWAKSQLLSFEHACNRVALRQGVITTILYAVEGELELPATWSFLDKFSGNKDDKEDFIWADMHLRHLCHVLRFHMSRKYDDQPTRERRYRTLQEYVCTWESDKPHSFAPYHSPHRHQHQYQQPPPYQSKETIQSPHPASFGLSDIWLLNEEALVGTQYLYLARIVLADNKPTIHDSRGVEFSRVAGIRDDVASICGMACNSSKSLFAQDLAYAAVNFTTPRFHSIQEQDILLHAVRWMEENFKWPVESRLETLYHCYNRQYEAEQAAMTRRDNARRGGLSLTLPALERKPPIG